MRGAVLLSSELCCAPAGVWCACRREGRRCWTASSRRASATWGPASSASWSSTRRSGATGGRQLAGCPGWLAWLVWRRGGMAPGMLASHGGCAGTRHTARLQRPSWATPWLPPGAAGTRCSTARRSACPTGWRSWRCSGLPSRSPRWAALGCPGLPWAALGCMCRCGGVCCPWPAPAPWPGARASLDQRPGPRHAHLTGTRAAAAARCCCQVGGLYMVGASSRPGNGVPLVMIGAELAVQRVLADQQRPAGGA